MNQGRGGVGLRLFVTGNAEAKRDFDEFRNSGKRAFSEIGAGARQANPFLTAFSRGVGDAKDRVAGLAEGTGSAGKMLGAFGVAGVAAAAALGGLAIAVGQARAAMQFADEIGDAAAKVGIGTSALQEYRYAVQQTGGEFEQADDAIAGFTRALGAAESGLSPKVLKAFESLGFTKEQLKNFDSADDALLAVTDRIASLSSEAERAAVADKLGLTPMLPLLRRGADGVRDLREEARQLGFVMDEELVQKAGDANDKLEALNHVIDVQLKSAFVDLAPYIVQATEALANLLKGIASFLNDSRTHVALDVIGQLIGAGAKGGFGGLSQKATEIAIDRLRNPGKYSAIPDMPLDEDDPDVIRQRYLARQQQGAGGGTSLNVPTRTPRAKAPKKPKLGGTPINESDLMIAIDPETGEYLKQRSSKDWAFKDFMGYFPGEAPKLERPVIDPDVDLTHVDDKLKGWISDTRDDLRDGFADGIMAAFDGHLTDFIKEKLLNALVGGLADSLANAFMSATKNGGFGSGGGTGNFILNAAMAIFGRHAAGGMVNPGEASSVAEYGDELALFGRHGQVYSHDETVRMLQQVAGGGQGAGGVTVAVTYSPSYAVQGSGPELDRLRGMIDEDRRTFHGRVVGAVNDGLNRRQIRG